MAKTRAEKGSASACVLRNVGDAWNCFALEPFLFAIPMVTGVPVTMF